MTRRTQGRGEALATTMVDEDTIFEMLCANDEEEDADNHDSEKEDNME